MKLKKLFLIDGSGFIFRAFYALPPLTNPDGIPINAVYGYCNMILNIYEKFKPEKIIVVFDTRKKHLEMIYIKNINQIDLQHLIILRCRYLFYTIY